MKVKIKRIFEGGLVDKFIELVEYAESGMFDEKQLEQISKGLNGDIDVRVYATSDYNHHQMREIRLGLEFGADVSLYAKPELHYIEMKIIRMGMLLLQDDEYRSANFGREEVEEAKHAFRLLDLEKDFEIEM